MIQNTIQAIESVLNSAFRSGLQMITRIEPEKTIIIAKAGCEYDPYRRHLQAKREKSWQCGKLGWAKASFYDN